MLIIGKTPDIFDHMPYAYGVDNKVVFDKRVYDSLPRKKINTLDDHSYCADIAFTVEHGFDRDYYIENKLHDSWKYFQRKNDPHPKVKYTLSSFFYCGVILLLARKLVRNDSSMILGHYTALDEYYLVSDKKDGSPYCINANKALIEYAMENNIPFFEYKLDRNTPNYVTIQPQLNYLPLHRIKHSNFEDANLIYNDIYNYMLSYMNDNDIIQVSNEDKIKQAGFDLKTSFRNM
jgi:hypothetical protein